MTVTKSTIKHTRTLKKNPITTIHNKKTKKNNSSKKSNDKINASKSKHNIKHKQKLKLKIKRSSQSGGNKYDTAKCDQTKLNDLLAGNPPVRISEELPKQTITADDVAGFNGKGFGTTPGAPPKFPSGCTIL